jgi:CO/xanthine dehydrogenase FAD-binding subunit
VAITVKSFEKFGDAAAALSSDRGARFLAGGTLVMRAVNEGDVSISTIVRSTDPAISQISAAGARIAIGSGVTMAQILANRDLAFLHPAARIVGGPAVRGMASVGGNLFAPSPYGDFTAALLALDATVSVTGGYSASETPLEEFLASRDRGTRGLVASVSIPRLPNPDEFRFRKVSRVKPKGIAVLSIAALLPVAGGRITGVRIAYNAMAPMPMRAKAAERALEGRSLDEAGISAALAACAEGTAPADDAIASAWYRREILPIHLKRLLLGQPA